MVACTTPPWGNGRIAKTVLETTSVSELTAKLVAHAVETLGCEGACLVRRDDDGTLRAIESVGWLAGLLAAAAATANGTTPARPPFVAYPYGPPGEVFAIFVVRRASGRDAELDSLAAHLHLATQNARLLDRALLAQRLAVVGELAAGMAHELSTPVTAVAANAAMAAGALHEGDLDRVAERLADVLECSERIFAIASEVRHLAGLDTNEETFEIGDAVRSALRVAGASVRASADLETSLAAGAVVRGSRGRLAQVLVNLVVNAAQAGATAGRRTRIAIATARVGDAVVVEVRDDGPGIPPERLARVFEPFFTTKGSKGLGLGLSISRRIAEAHGGSLEACSEPGRGATFTLRLPAGK